MGIKYISFDMDGTLIHQQFADLVWLEGIPKLYAAHHGGTITGAKKFLIQEYDKIGRDAIEWYDIQYWFKKLELPGDWQTLLDSYQDHVKLFPEVPHVLKSLNKLYPLIVVSNAAHEFLEMELDVSGLKHSFQHIFSAVTDFRKTKKETDVYRHICRFLGIQQTELVHVGDDWQFDYLTPRELGISAYYLNRDRQHHTPHQDTLYDLRELLPKIID